VRGAGPSPGGRWTSLQHVEISKKSQMAPYLKNREGTQRNPGTQGVGSCGFGGTPETPRNGSPCHPQIAYRMSERQHGAIRTSGSNWMNDYKKVQIIHFVALGGKEKRDHGYCNPVWREHTTLASKSKIGGKEWGINKNEIGPGRSGRVQNESCRAAGD